MVQYVPGSNVATATRHESFPSVLLAKTLVFISNSIGGGERCVHRVLVEKREGKRSIGETQT